MKFSPQALTKARGAGSQADLAKRTGLSVFTISRLENGHHTPEFDTIVKLAQALDLPLDALLEPNGDGSTAA